MEEALFLPPRRPPPAIDGRMSATDLLPIVYDDLRRLAQSRLAHERRGHSLVATELVHEAFLRLVGDRAQGWETKAQFFAAAAEAMRRILIEQARARHRIKRSGCQQRTALTGVELGREEHLDQVLIVDEALLKLEPMHPRAVQIVRMRFYAGLSEERTAAVLGLAPRTVRREWSYARAWLRSVLREAE